MRKLSATRLVKFLKNKSSDEAFKTIKDKNLGPLIHNKRIKVKGGGAESGVAMVGDKAKGAVITKKVDVKNSPVTDTPSTLKKIKENIKLQKDPSTTNDFTHYVKGSTNIAKDKSVLSYKTTYSPGIPSKREYALNTQSIIREGKEIQRKSRKVLGDQVEDVGKNVYNYNPKTKEVLDFMATGSYKPQRHQKLFNKIRERKIEGFDVPFRDPKKQLRPARTKKREKKQERNKAILRKIESDDNLRESFNRNPGITFFNPKNKTTSEYLEASEAYGEKVMSKNPKHRYDELAKRHNSPYPKAFTRRAKDVKPKPMAHLTKKKPKKVDESTLAWLNRF